MAQTSALEYALVGLLKQKPQSGYDLRKEFATTPMRHYSDSPGSIYPALRRLQARTWVKANSQTEGRKRQLFRVTAVGDRAFTAWLQQPPTRDDLIWRMEEVTLRFAFHSGNVPVTATRHFLEVLEHELAAYVGELRRYASQSGLANQNSTGALAFASGIAGYESDLNWAKRTRRKFTEKKS